VQAADREIRDQQNSAYEASLARDRQRARERKEAEERRKREEAEAAKRAEEIEMVERKKEMWKRWRASKIPKEEPTGSVTRIQIRTADGQRIVRKFEKETAMEEVYAFVECMDVDRDLLSNGLSQPEGYEHVYPFRLVSMMPRKVFSPHEGTVGEHLWPSGNLVVEAVDGDEEE
jgi:FAS-associated factor 2